MPITVAPPLRPQPNWDVLNSVHSGASNAYRQQVPVATQANIQETMTKVWEFEGIRNEAVHALINRIGTTIIHHQLYSNPLAKYKREAMLNGGSIVEEIQIDIAEAHTYDVTREALEKEIYGQHVLGVQSAFHTINREEYFPVSINDKILRRAFLGGAGETSLWDFVAKMIASAQNSDQYSEYLVSRQLFAEYHKNHGFYIVNVPDVSALSSTEVQAKQILRQIKAMSSKLEFYSRDYNAAHLMSFAPKGTLELFVTPDVFAAIEVNALAAAFNIDKLDVMDHVTIIDDFGIEGAQAIVTVRDWFVIVDTLIETREQQNPVTLGTNYFFHHHQIVSASRMVPAILFSSTEASTVIPDDYEPVTGISGITLYNRNGQEVTTVKRGQSYVAFAEATTDGINDGVRYELISKTNGPKSGFTTITASQDGQADIEVSIDESSTALTIKATALDADLNEFVTTTDVTVYGSRRHFWPFSVDKDADDDGLFEVTPDAPVKTGTTVTIPTSNAQRVQYKKAGTDVAAGSSSTISGATTYTAVAKAGWELDAGATASWTFNP